MSYFSVKDALGATVKFLGDVDGSLQWTPWRRAVAGTSGGCSLYRNINLGVTGQVVKASAGQLYGWSCMGLQNDAGSPPTGETVYLKIYDKATAAAETDTPVMTIPLPYEVAVQGQVEVGLVFSAGISVRASTAIADNDTGAPDANGVTVNLFYK